MQMNKTYNGTDLMLRSIFKSVVFTFTILFVTTSWMQAQVVSRQGNLDYSFVVFDYPIMDAPAETFTQNEWKKIDETHHFTKLNSVHINNNNFDVKFHCNDGSRIALIVKLFRGMSARAILKDLKLDSKSQTFNSSYKQALLDVDLTRVRENDNMPQGDTASFLLIDITAVSQLAITTNNSTNIVREQNQGRPNSLDFCSIVDQGLAIDVQFNDDIKLSFALKKEIDLFPINEPRQYVTIYETDPGNRDAKPVWWLEKRVDPLSKGSDVPSIKFYPRQKHQVISNKNILEIRFDQEAIARNINFQGSISLAANSGESKIEVAPYYVIGQEQTSLGVSAMPIKELADYFLRLMIESERFIRDWESAEEGFVSLTSSPESPRGVAAVQEKKATVRRILRRVREYTNRMDSTATIIPDKRLFFDLLDLQRAINNDILSLIIEQLDPVYPAKFAKPFHVAELKQLLGNVEINLDTIAKSSIEEMNFELANGLGLTPTTGTGPGGLKNQLSQLLSNCQLLYALLNRIKASNDQTINAFLSFTTLTVTDFNEIVRRTEIEINKIKDVKVSTDPSMKQKVDEVREIYVRYEATFNEIGAIFKSFSGSSVLLTKLLKDHGYSKNIRLNNDDADTIRRKSFIELANDAASYNTIRDEFALHAGQEIFKRLVYARIDLSNEKIADGDELTISVVWYNSDGNTKSNTNDKSDAVNLATAKFIIKKVGWDLDVAESALLIHRFQEGRLRRDYPLSPSNFKPSVGASLLWTFYNTYRVPDKIKHSFLVSEKNHGKAKQYPLLRFLHWLEPSMGINVSYNDFRTDREVEFGAGPIIGLFRNRIFFTSGYNFSVNGESPFYFGIGFSFSKIYQRIKDNEGK